VGNGVGQLLNRDADALDHAENVGELQVDELDALTRGVLQHLGGLGR